MNDDLSGLTYITIPIDDNVYKALHDEAAENQISVDELIISRIVGFNEIVERASAVEQKAIKLTADIATLVGKGRLRAND